MICNFIHKKHFEQSQEHPSQGDSSNFHVDSMETSNGLRIILLTHLRVSNIKIIIKPLSLHHPFLISRSKVSNIWSKIHEFSNINYPNEVPFELKHMSSIILHQYPTWNSWDSKVGWDDPITLRWRVTSTLYFLMKICMGKRSSKKQSWIQGLPKMCKNLLVIQYLKTSSK